MEKTLEIRLSQEEIKQLISAHVNGTVKGWTAQRITCLSDDSYVIAMKETPVESSNKPSHPICICGHYVHLDDGGYCPNADCHCSKHMDRNA